MSDVVSSDELNTLAAEFVLGTLDYDERKGATALLEVDHAFRGIVRIWERRLGELHLMVEAVEPDPQLWTRIRPKIGSIEQVALAIPSHAVEHAMEEEAAVAPAAETGRDDGALPAAALAPPPAAGPADDERPAELPPSLLAPEPTVEASPPATEVPPPPTESATAIEARSALADAELRLAELAALLPPAGQQEYPPESEAPATPPEQPPAEQPPAEQPPSEQPSSEQPPSVLVDEDLLRPREPEPVTHGFVPPPPMVMRHAPVAVETVRRGGRGWIAATLLMGVVAIALAGLIGAWRYFPERLPQPLAIDSVLNLHAPPPPPPARPLPPPFEE